MRGKSCWAPIVLAAMLASACRASVENRDPLGARFPAVTGESLAGAAVELPPGRPAVLLVGYVQDAQFDADRWLYGLLQAELPVDVLEIPTIPGLFPSALAGTIDSGMRSGIPSEDWSSVVTLYGARAEEVVALTGNENPRNIRVLLLDRDGEVVWFHDRGFSAGKLLELERSAEALVADGSSP
jgi:hypothetical protein